MEDTHPPTPAPSPAPFQPRLVSHKRSMLSESYSYNGGDNEGHLDSAGSTSSSYGSRQPQKRSINDLDDTNDISDQDDLVYVSPEGYPQNYNDHGHGATHAQGQNMTASLPTFKYSIAAANRSNPPADELLSLVQETFMSMSSAEKSRFIQGLLINCDRSVLVPTLKYIDPLLRKDPFALFPNEVSLKILNFLDDPQSLARASQVSKLWYLLVSDDYTWKELCQKHHFRRLSAAVNIDHQRVPSVSMENGHIESGIIAEAFYNPLATRRPLPRNYRSHFKQQFLLNSAWATGGRTAARYTIDHTGVVTALVVSEKYIVIALDNSKIFVFRQDGKMLRSLFGHVMGVWALALYEDVLISGGCDRDVRAWDLQTGGCTQIMKGHSSTVRCLQLVDSFTAVSGSRDSTVRVWDLHRGVCAHVLQGHDLSVRCVEVAGDLCVSGSYDATAKIWNVRTGTLVHTLSGHFSQIYSLAFDGTRVATGSLDASIRIWDAQLGVCLALLQGHTSLVGQLQLKGNTLVSGGSDGAIRVWDMKEYKCITRIAAHDNSVTCLSFDDERIVSGGSDGQVQVWDLHNGAHIRDLSGQFEMVWRVDIIGDEVVIVASKNGKAILDVTSFTPPVEETLPTVEESSPFSSAQTLKPEDEDTLMVPVEMHSPKSDVSGTSPRITSMDLS